jgi:hypothetical protein
MAFLICYLDCYGFEDLDWLRKARSRPAKWLTGESSLNPEDSSRGAALLQPSVGDSRVSGQPRRSPEMARRVVEFRFDKTG